ncbi:hypothetical protein QJQ45_005112 [Haematococcus lacustris]|nr:hypothetical protein QJQ45_005112 [Haematococcus lacustris]
MVDKRRGVKANCASVQKAREVTAQPRAAEAAGPIEIGAQAGVIAAEAQAQADAGADEADAQLRQLQADLQHRELQLAHNLRMQQLQQQLQDLQRSELQRKEQQLADLVAQQRAALLQWEHQLIERQHQLQQQQVDLSRREQDLTERKQQQQQQQADLNSREQQQARIQTLTQQLHSLQQELKAQQVPCHAQDTSASHRLRGHIMFRRYLVLDKARQADVCSMPDADVERMHDDVVGCKAMHRMVFTPDREQPQWAMAACACSTCMSVPCLPCMKPDTTTPLKPMPMFQDTVKEVRDDEECYALLMLYHSDLLHDEVCFGKLTNKHCERYRMHMGWKRQEGRRLLRRLVLRELQSEQLEAEYEADN